MDLSSAPKPLQQPPKTQPYPCHLAPNPPFAEGLDTPLFIIPSTNLASTYATALGTSPVYSSGTASRDATSSQLYSSELCNPNILYRPTPIHPISSTSVNLPAKPELPADPCDADLPLDLSCSSKSHQQSSSQVAKEESFLPTCINSNSNWIASRLGPNRMSYPREFKLMVINYYQSHGQNKYRTCKEFQITKSMLNGWLQKVDKIIQSRPGSLKSGRSGRKPQFPDIEKQLFTLYCEQLEAGRRVGNRWIRETAKNLAQQQCSQQELAGMCQFSERWLSNFKKRYHINLHRNWSSGSSSVSSMESPSSESSITGDSGHPSPIKSENNADSDSSEMEDVDSDHESFKSESLETPIETDVVSSFSQTVTFGQEQANEVLKKTGQLPIVTFYERFPWLCKKSNAGGEPARRGRKVQFPDVEKILFDRLQEKQMRGERVSNRWLQDQARELALQLCPGILEEATKSARCLFSEHWLHNFKKRYDISLKPSSGPSKPSPTERAKSTNKVEPSDEALQAAPHPPSATQNPPDDPPKLPAVFPFQNWFLSQCYQPQLAPAPNVSSAI